jgi:hypothetical protein
MHPPDLDKPSLRGLNLVLRHRELWPVGFEWDYRSCPNCAMGLAQRLWKEIEFPVESYIAKAFGMSAASAQKIFYYADISRKILRKNVTPEMIADDIEAYLRTGDAD